MQAWRPLTKLFNRLARFRDVEQRMSAAEELAGMGSFEWHAATDQIIWSDNLARIYGYEPGAHPKTLAEFLGRIHPDDRDAVQETIRDALQSGSQWHMDERIIRANDGEIRLLTSRVKALRDGVGRIVRMCGVCRDVTEERRSEEALAAAEARFVHGALHDPLTTLPNRALLLDRLNGALTRSRREGTSLGVLLIDLDNFKNINDTMGHAVGDEVLRAVADRLLAALQEGDTAARIGGDEFVMVFENVTHESLVLSIAHRVAAMVTAPITASAQEFITTASIGIAVSQGNERPEDLLRDADLALHRAKRHGKNRTEVFDETLRTQAMDRLKVEGELRRALNDGLLEPYYQPIIALATGNVCGFEALARWHHPDRGLLLPSHFLPVAEDAHLIGQLGSVMLRAACRQLAVWHEQRPDLTMAVNLSPLQLSPGFSKEMAEVLRECGLAPHCLHIEVTESVLLDIHKSALSELRDLSARGIQLAIDDFGTGYSSLLYLKRFPVRFIKIDRSFVGGLPGSQQDAAIIEAIANLAGALGLSTIAEGVETAGQLQALKRLQCTYAQGYYISEPKPASECALSRRY